MFWTVLIPISALALVSVLLIHLVGHWRDKRLIARWLHEHHCEVRTIKRAQVGRVEWDSRMPCYYVV